jgi:hypothetical protein
MILAALEIGRALVAIFERALRRRAAREPQAQRPAASPVPTERLDRR